MFSVTIEGYEGVYEVYNIKDDVNIRFLIYITGKWGWVLASLCKPVKNDFSPVINIGSGYDIDSLIKTMEKNLKEKGCI